MPAPRHTLLNKLRTMFLSVQPPLAEAEAARDAALAGLVASLAVASLPAAPTTADVRGAVQQLLEEARRLPAMPPMPVNYEELLADVEKWLAELAGTRADVAAAQAAAAASAADGAAQLAAADEGADPEGWHRLNWLRQAWETNGLACRLVFKLACLPASHRSPLFC